jgi:hypothetical protein
MMGPIVRLETSVMNYQTTLRKIKEEQRSFKGLVVEKLVYWISDIKEIQCVRKVAVHLGYGT